MVGSRGRALRVALGGFDDLGLAPGLSHQAAGGGDQAQAGGGGRRAVSGNNGLSVLSSQFSTNRVGVEQCEPFEQCEQIYRS